MRGLARRFARLAAWLFPWPVEPLPRRRPRDAWDDLDALRGDMEAVGGDFQRALDRAVGARR